MTRRKGLFLALAGTALFVGVNVAHTAARSAGYPAYWRERARATVPDRAIRIVALGDSSVQAVGADHPLDGYVGRIAAYIESRTGRPVHITNVSSATRVAGILRDELQRVDLATADIVIVADTNDMESRVPIAEHREDLRRLAERLPADRTIFSDLPPFPGRERYQAALEEVTDVHGILRADVHAILNGEGRRLDIFSWLPPHLNSKGYDYWFRAFRPQVDTVLARRSLSR